MGMDRNQRRIQTMFLAVTLITPIFLVAGVVLGGPEAFIAGLGVEVIGAWLTAGAALGLGLLFSVQDQEIIKLQQQIAAQDAKLDRLEKLLTQSLENRDGD